MADFADPGAEPPAQTQSHEWTPKYTPTVRGHSPEDQHLSNPSTFGTAAASQTVAIPSPASRNHPSIFHQSSQPGYGVDLPALNDLVEVLDERGDLILVVGEQRQEFLVCSRTLRRASLVFEQLYERQRFTGDDGQVRLDLSHIGIAPMHLVLLVIHGAPAMVYSKITESSGSLLHDVLVITNHFKMTKCLAPIAVKWLKKVYNKEPTNYKDIAVQLWITHSLGHLTCLRQTIHNMVTGGRLNAKGDLIGQGAGDNDDYRRFPTLQLLDVLDKVQECRRNVITTLLSIMNEAVQNLTQSPRQPAATVTNGPPPKPTVCRVPGESPARRRQCDCRMLGALHRAMYDVHWAQAYHKSMSPQRLHSKISEICRQTLKEYEPPSDGHRRCEPFGGKLRDLIQIVDAEVTKIPFDEDYFMTRGTEMGFNNIK